jgi:beta-glucosidase
VIFAGRPLTFHSVAERADALLYAWHPGTMGGPAIADLLFGDAAPSGKLPITFPRTVGQVPIYYAHLNTGRPPSATDLGIPLGNPVNPVGYLSKYIDVDVTPEYNFGFGLSYTQFEYSNLRLSARTLMKEKPLTVSATITNRGKRAGDEIVQLYIHQRTASVAQPVRELKGFERIHLMPGESTEVKFTLAAESLMFHNPHGRPVIEPGAFDLWVAPDSAGGLHESFTLQ